MNDLRYTALAREDLVTIGRNLWDFKRSSQLQSCIIVFLVGFQQNKAEQVSLRRKFEAVDTNKDGFITRDELEIFKQEAL